jgi:hypothetical protein
VRGTPGPKHRLLRRIISVDYRSKHSVAVPGDLAEVWLELKGRAFRGVDSQRVSSHANTPSASLRSGLGHPQRQ